MTTADVQRVNVPRYLHLCNIHRPGEDHWNVQLLHWRTRHLYNIATERPPTYPLLQAKLLYGYI